MPTLLGRLLARLRGPHPASPPASEPRHALPPRPVERPGEEALQLRAQVRQNPDLDAATLEKWLSLETSSAEMLRFLTETSTVTYRHLAYRSMRPECVDARTLDVIFKEGRTFFLSSLLENPHLDDRAAAELAQRLAGLLHSHLWVRDTASFRSFLGSLNSLRRFPSVTQAVDLAPLLSAVLGEELSSRGRPAEMDARMELGAALFDWETLTPEQAEGIYKFMRYDFTLQDLPLLQKIGRARSTPLSVLRLMAHMPPPGCIFPFHEAVASNPLAVQDEEIRTVLLEQGDLDVLAALAPHLETEAYLRLFRSLPARGIVPNVALLEAPGARALSREDLLPLLSAASAELRLAAIRLAGQLPPTPPSPPSPVPAMAEAVQLSRGRSR